MGKFLENEVQQSAEDEQADFGLMAIGQTRMYLIKLLINVTKISTDVHSNSNAYIEFSTLSLLHYLFHSIMPSPTFSNEVYKLQNSEIYKKARSKDTPDLLKIDLFSLPKLEIRNENRIYVCYRNEYFNIDSISDDLKHNISCLIKMGLIFSNKLDPIYLNMRLKLVMNMWNYVKTSLDSKWASIKKVAYKVVV